jgi:hypothetical protein
MIYFKEFFSIFFFANQNPISPLNQQKNKNNTIYILHTANVIKKSLFI